MGRPESIQSRGPHCAARSGEQRERAAWRSKRKAPGGFKAKCHRGRLDVPPGPRLAWWGRSPKAWSTTQLPTLGTLPGGAGEAASLVSKLPRGLGRIARNRALSKPGSAARFPAPRPSSNGRRGPPLRRGEGPRTGPPPERSRGGSGARRIAPAAFGDFWPDKSRAPVPARGGYFPRRWRGSNSAQGALPVLRTEYSAAWSRFLQGAACAAICQAAARRN